MNIIKLILGIFLVFIVVSYPLIGAVALKGIGIPFILTLVLGIFALIGGIKLIYDGVTEP